ncbi:hypothetical protein [Blastopirellula marina]|uniref:Uncharacterized protein n=1 Tax=Blastopirellula marina TaxID=124 RepID=A0A2S8GG67_9BACT|nr:hypothetical protein [Blastopirellula marina]PQO43456.1 hypothetical protein C5Y93_22630 [Blastopirellula marina]
MRRKGTLGYQRLRKSSRPRFQVRLSTLLLLTACIGVWCAYFQANRKLATKRVATRAVQRVAHRMYIDDPQQYAVAVLDPLRDDYAGRRVYYLPPGNRYTISYLPSDELRQEAPDEEIAESLQAEIEPGRRLIEFRVADDAPSRWQVIVDEEVVFERSFPDQWNNKRRELFVKGALYVTGKFSWQQSTESPLIVRDGMTSDPNSLLGFKKSYSVLIQAIGKEGEPESAVPRN